MRHFTDSDYCTFVEPNGRRCRAGKVPTREVCIAHWKHDGEFFEDPAASAELASLATSLKTSRGINRFLSALVRLTSEDRVPHRKATLLTYQAQLALYALGRPPQQRDAQRTQKAFDSAEPPALTAVEAPAMPNGSAHGANGSAASVPEHAE